MVAALTLVSLAACSSQLRNENRKALSSVESGLVPLRAVDGSDGSRSSAPPSATLDGSLAGYVAHGFSSSPDLRAAFEEWRASIEHADRPRHLPDPELTYTFFIRHVETRVGPQRHKVSLMQWFPWPTQITAAGDSGDLMAQAHQRRFEAQALDLASQIAAVYWRLWLLDRAREVNVAEKSILEALGAQVRARMEVGQADLAHLAQINLGISRIDDHIDGVAEQRRGLEASMRRLIGAEPDLAVPVDNASPAMTVPKDTASLRDSALTHPQVDAIELAARAEDENARSERGKRFPGLGLGVAWIETGPALDP